MSQYLGTSRARFTLFPPNTQKQGVIMATRIFTVLLVSFCCWATVSAQVFDSGPSDSTLFTNLINLPEDALPDPVFGQVLVGGVAGETTQVNVPSGSSLGLVPLSDTAASVITRNGAEVNISGGSVGRLAAGGGSEVNLSSGSLGIFF